MQKWLIVSRKDVETTMKNQADATFGKGILLEKEA
jgi:hypothetical protein